MKGLSAFEAIINKKLLNLHTAYLAKVISTNGVTAKIQPLGYVKAYGENAQKQSVLSSVPISKSAYKVREKTITYISEVDFEKKEIKEKTETFSELVPVSAGDIVICDVCERDITEAKKGKNSLPTIGHHSMSDSIIVGVL